MNTITKLIWRGCKNTEPNFLAQFFFSHQSNKRNRARREEIKNKGNRPRKPGSSRDPIRFPFLCSDRRSPPGEIAVKEAPVRQEDAGDGENADEISYGHLLEGMRGDSDENDDGGQENQRGFEGGVFGHGSRAEKEGRNERIIEAAAIAEKRACGGGV